jgi:hypothetical protein
MFVRKFFIALTKITILDPTCGSGAFLFAALNILEPLYEICIQRMEEWWKTNPKGNTDFEDRLTTLHSSEHPNLSYYIFKTIILNNLYGVDLMKEAVEIAKLRLFLKLVAEVDPSKRKKNYGLEPLPDIDFNIRSGNTLVGFATEQQLEEVVKNTEGELIYNEKLNELKSKCKSVEKIFNHFQEIQIEVGSNNEKYKEIKKSLTAALKELDEKLNRYLADTYGLGAKTQWKSKKEKETTYQAWKESHQPFHWFAEFYGIISKGGFDVVIGNPPYVEYSKVRKDYIVKEYETESCGNLYAFVVEKAIGLLKLCGNFGMIIPLSFCCSDRINTLRKMVIDKIEYVYISNYEIFPSKLFEGAFQRLSIFLGHRSLNNNKERYVTKLHRWYSIERDYLIDCIEYVNVFIEENNFIPLFGKFRTKSHINIISKLLHNNKKVTNFTVNVKSDNFIYYQEATNYWMKVSSRIPYFKKNGKVEKPAHGRFIFFDSKEKAIGILSMIYSSLFYLWYITYSDGFHLSDFIVKAFPIKEDLLVSNEITELGNNLEADIGKNALITTRNTKQDNIEIESYKIVFSKPIIDEIDTFLAKHYGFTEEELDFIINYDIKYRMGSELEGEE